MIIIKNLKLKIKSCFLRLRETRKEKGFTLLFAILVSVLILAVGTSIISIALKQVILSGAGRDSQFAFYASNTGLECALYWDLHPKLEGETRKYVFPAKFTDRGIDQEKWTEDGLITCLQGQIRDGIGFQSVPFITDSDAYDWDTVNKFKFRMTVNNNIIDPKNDFVNDILYCVEVTVEKSWDVSGIITTIYSRGLNTCDPENNPRAIERGLVLKYSS